VHRLLAACRERGLAHALAHPLDGHRCDLPTTLGVVAACKLVETVNGGFSGDSTRRLERFVALYNRVPWGAAGAEGGGGGASPRRVDEPVDGIVPWGGSDAHLGDYARVRMVWQPRGEGGMADLLRDMAETPARELLAEGAFAIDGRGARLAGTLGEVLRLVARNASRNRATFRGPRRLARLAAIGPALAVRRVLELRRAKERLGRELDALLEAAAGEEALPPDAGGQLACPRLAVAAATPREASSRPTPG
jgi:hypothetical protein